MTAASRTNGHWLQGAQGEVASAVTGDATLIATPTLSAPGRDPKHPGATHLELVRFSGSNQLGDEKVCVKKVHVLIQEAVQDEQAVGPGRQGGVRVEVVPSSPAQRQLVPVSSSSPGAARAEVTGSGGRGTELRGGDTPA